MRIPLLFLACFFLFPFAGNSQNLVVNGGFERQAPRVAGEWAPPLTPCTFSNQSVFLNTNALGWRTFDTQTPDLLLWDSTSVCPMFPKPRRGNRMVGLIMYHPFQDGQFAFDYHELIQGTLSRPLEKGKTYTISFWVYTNDSLGIQHLKRVFGAGSFQRVKDERLKPGGFREVYCGNFGFFFSNNKIQTREEFMQSQVTFPVSPQVNSLAIIEDVGGWQKISLSYTPDQPYKYFLFGNFFSDAITPINMGETERYELDQRNEQLQFWSKMKRIGYYLFDDFAIVEENAIEMALLKEKRYTFQSALLFDTGKSDLKPESKAAIEELADALIKNPSLKIEIGGHTDNVGEEASNQILSDLRARSVYDALVAGKVNSSQISWKGYGELRPVSTNDTEAGRQKNRRVECQVLDISGSK